MIVCSCNVLSDRDVRAVAAGCRASLTVARIYDGLGCRPQCGTCARSILAIVREMGADNEGFVQVSACGLAFDNCVQVTQPAAACPTKEAQERPRSNRAVQDQLVRMMECRS